MTSTIDSAFPLAHKQILTIQTPTGPQMIAAESTRAHTLKARRETSAPVRRQTSTCPLSSAYQGTLSGTTQCPRGSVAPKSESCGASRCHIPRPLLCQSKMVPNRSSIGRKTGSASTPSPRVACLWATTTRWAMAETISLL